MVSGCEKVTVTRSQFWQLVVAGLVILAMAALSLSSHFFGVPAMSDVDPCEFAGTCGGYLLYMNP